MTATPDRGRLLLVALKAMSGGTGPVLTIPAGPGADVVLRPVSVEPGRLNSHDVRVLTEWRNRFPSSFLHEFRATETRTAGWLSQRVRTDDTRILFMVDDVRGETVGYIGLAFIDWTTGWGEVDAAVRGREAPRGTMSRALRTLVSWAKGQLGLERIGVRVRSDNPALAFYRKLGFVELRRVSLRRESGPDGVKWLEDPHLTSEVMLVYMELVERRDPIEAAPRATDTSC